MLNLEQMSSEDLRAHMLAVIPDPYWVDGEVAKTPEYINYMYVVTMVDCGLNAGGLQNLLDTINKHYEGPISIHEGDGGIDANSNLELITEKLRFDLSNDAFDPQTVLAAVSLGWLPFSDLQFAMCESIMSHTIGSTFEDGEIHLHYSEGANAVCISHFGMKDKWKEVVDQKYIDMPELEFLQLTNSLLLLNDDDLQAEYLSAFVKSKTKAEEPTV